MVNDAQNLVELASNFSLLEDWEDRYAYLIELGKKLPPFPEAEKNSVNLVRGCTSQVWLIPETDMEQGAIAFMADSDSHIVRGLIAVLREVYFGRPPEFIRNFNIKDYFSELGLEDHLSPNRRNGFYAMVDVIKALAA